MAGRVILFTLITFLFIFLDFKKRKNYKKSILAIAIFIFIVSLGYMGYILMRAVAPIFIIHILLVILAYGALLWYLLRDKLYYYIVASPALTVAIYFIMNFIEGSRYES